MFYDIVIVGASTSGLFAAHILAKNGKKVAVVERDDRISPEPRIYIITKGIHRVMPDFDQALVRKAPDRIQLIAGGHQKTIHLAAPDLVVDRAELILDLHERCSLAGVHFLSGWRFCGLEEDGRQPRLVIEKDGRAQGITTKCLIGADGADSQVGGLISKKGLDSVPLLQAEVDLPADDDDRIVKVWFNLDDTPYFYWLIPDKGGKAVVGLISRQGADVRNLLDDFLQEKGYLAISYQGGTVPLYNKPRKLSARIGEMDLFLIGDAAGQVKVTTVGGTVTGLAGAAAASRAALEGTSYENQLRILNRELWLHHFVRGMLNELPENGYEDLIKMINPAVGRFLREYDRDQMRANFWKMAFYQPGFIPFGVELLFRKIIPS